LLLQLLPIQAKSPLLIEPTPLKKGRFSGWSE
jgi:hypothetical protein